MTATATFFNVRTALTRPDPQLSALPKRSNGANLSATNPDHGSKAEIGEPLRVCYLAPVYAFTTLGFSVARAFSRFWPCS